MSYFLKSVAILGVMAGVACQPISGTSLLGDKRELSSGYTVDTTPKEEELYMKANKSQLFGTGLAKVEISGECYVSTYSSHYIQAFIGATPVAGMIDLLNPGVSVGQARCTNGVFNVSLPLASPFVSGANNQVRLQIYANGGAVTNDVQGAVRVNVSY